MASLPGVRFDISGASGSQGLLSPKDGWRAYFLPRGAHAAQDSTGTLITFDSADAASRFAVGNWIQAGLLTSTIRQVGAVGGNSISVSGSALTISENTRIFLIGNTEPTVSGGSATYTTPNTIIRQRDDDAADIYTNSMITTNVDGLVQGFGGTALYDVIIQDGNRANQGSIVDFEIGVAQGISVSDTAIFGQTVTMLQGLSVNGNAAFGATVTIATGPSGIQNAAAFAVGSSTGGIQEAHDRLPTTGGIILMSGISFLTLRTITISKNMVTLMGMGDSTVLQRGWNPTYDGNNGALISVTGQSCLLKDFVLDANRVTFSGDGDALLIKGASSCTIVNVHPRNYKVYGINLQDSPDAIVTRCRVSGGLRAGIYGNNTTGSSSSATGCVVTHNVVDCRGATSNVETCIAFFALISGKNVNDTSVVGNRCITGTGFGVEIQASGGNAPRNPVVTGNIVIQGTTSSDAGGISLDGVHGGAVNSNSYDTGGFGAVSGIELVGCSGTAVNGNTIDGRGTLTQCVSIDKSSYCSVTANPVKNFSSGGFGILIIPNTAGSSADGNIVESNPITFLSGLTGSGIRMRTSSTGTTVDRNRIHGNIIVGDGTVGQYGIDMGAASGSTQNSRFNSVQDNTLHSLEQGIHLEAVTGFRNNLVKDNHFSSVTTPVSGLAQEISAVGDSLALFFSNRIDLTGNTSFTLTSTPTIADGYDGQELIVSMVGNTATITIQDQGTLAGSNLRLQGTSRSIGPRDSIALRFNGALGDWTEQWFSNVI